MLQQVLLKELFVLGHHFAEKKRLQIEATTALLIWLAECRWNGFSTSANKLSRSSPISGCFQRAAFTLFTYV